MATIAERMLQGLAMRGMKQADLARITGIGKSSISTYLTGEYEPKQKNIYKIALALNVNEAWLMGYDISHERQERPADESTGNPDIDAITQVLHTLPPEEVKRWRTTLDTLYEKHGETPDK